MVYSDGSTPPLSLRVPPLPLLALHRPAPLRCAAGAKVGMRDVWPFDRCRLCSKAAMSDTPEGPLVYDLHHLV